MPFQKNPPATFGVRSALITGGAGFIGSNLADALLTQGVAVRILDNLSRANTQRNLDWLRATHGEIEFCHGDVRNTNAVRDAVRGVDAVFHLAAQVAVTTSVESPLEDFEVNARGTLNTLEATRLTNPEALFVYTSTNKVYGRMDDIAACEQETRYEAQSYPYGIPESRSLDLHSPYGCSKGAADQYVRDYARIYGLKTVVFRMSCIYGPHQYGNEDQGWLAHFIISCLHNRRITIYGDGKQVRDVLYIGDLVRAFAAVTQQAPAAIGKIYNVGGGPSNTISVWAEFSRLLAESGVALPEVHHSDWRRGDQPVYVSDVRQIGSDLGWQPSVSPRAGIQHLLEWARASVNTTEQRAAKIGA